MLKDINSSILKLQKDKLVERKDGVVIKLSEFSTPKTNVANVTFSTQKIHSHPLGLNPTAKAK